MRSWLAWVVRAISVALFVGITVLGGGAAPVAAQDLVAAPQPAPPRAGSAEPARKLTPELLAAYVARQRALKNFRFDVPKPQTTLDARVLSAYVARRINPALSAIDMLSAPENSSVTDAMLAKYAATRYQPTAEKVKHADSELLCLAEAIYNEARGEPISGQWAVANVVINRAFSRRYPSTICGVVYQGVRSGSRHCQFSFACDGRPDIGTNKVAWRRANRIALAAFREFQRGKRPNVLPKSALFYHAKSVRPSWASSFREVASIGDHYFYAPL